MSYIDALIENGTNLRVEWKDGTASFSPASDLNAFQAVIRELRAHEGDGCDFHIEHPMRDSGRDLVDLVFVTLHER